MDESHLEVICRSYELLYAQFSTPLLYLLDGYSFSISVQLLHSGVAKPQVGTR